MTTYVFNNDNFIGKVENVNEHKEIIKKVLEIQDINCSEELEKLVDTECNFIEEDENGKFSINFSAFDFKTEKEMKESLILGDHEWKLRFPFSRKCVHESLRTLFENCIWPFDSERTDETNNNLKKLYNKAQKSISDKDVATLIDTVYEIEAICYIADWKIEKYFNIKN